MFRHLLVPLARLHEMLIRKDAEIIKRDVLKNIPEVHRESLMLLIAETFQKEVKGGKAGGYNFYLIFPYNMSCFPYNKNTYFICTTTFAFFLH